MHEENFGPVVHPDGTPSAFTLGMFGVELTMQHIQQLFTRLADKYGKKIQFAFDELGDTRSLFVIMTDDNNAYQWTIRQRGRQWSLEFETIDELHSFVDLQLEVLAGAE